jgi:D-alanyl-D-alanine carboxypeptidase
VPSAPVYDAAVAPIDEVTRGRMQHSWRPGCPVPLDALRLATLDHWGYDGVEHQGELVVHADHADAIVNTFLLLFDARFPIERMRLVDVYGGDDFASTADNNTAGFNCRSVVGRPGLWSEHAYGRAIDVNPLVNPYLGEPRLNDPRLAPYRDRSLDAPGMVRAGDVVVTAFAAEGWTWGGTWPTPDYQHFSSTGR